MPRAATNGIEIEYETFGSPSDEPLVLVMGLGAQMIFWEPDFCGMLAERGHFVVRFDNRDCGMSTTLDHLGVPNVQQNFADFMAGKSVQADYTLDDMADDTVGLMDALGFESAHVVGASMGGMIVQTLAYRHRERVRSVTSIMSSTGNPEVPPGKPEALAVLFRPPAQSKDQFVEQSVEAWKVIGSPGFPFDEERIRARSALSWERGYHPAGVARQMNGVLAHGDRSPNLATVDVPFLVIHGTDDPLVLVDGGQHTAQSVPGAELVLIEGMGHDLSPGTWPRIVDSIAKLTGTAEAAT